ncbi:PHA/PHB synthase family protein [Pseudoduganella sp. GCM10020061]|uniref:PHA/PHB synthase family protein n=1 Tax=Pseudoduganella sp. GCM10020061 TaxID=3317345 RepID=UPI003635FA61
MSAFVRAAPLDSGGDGAAKGAAQTQERKASGWQGTPVHRYPETTVEHATADLLLNAWLGRFTHSVSPAALGNAFFDWMTHLALAPSKHEQLALQGIDNMMKLAQVALKSAHGDDCYTCIEPLPQDRRFDAPQWKRYPFNIGYQAFLLQQQWWHRATTGVRGVSRHHQDVVTFITRQLLDWVAPSNFPATNPQVLDTTIATGGVNLAAGALRAWSDLLRAAGGAARRESRYVVGQNVAATPGKVVLRNHIMELIQYTPSTPRVHAVPVLFVPAWIMKYYILDLTETDSLVRYLVAQGHTVFMVSWKNPGQKERDLGMDDYRVHGVMAAIDEVCRRTGAGTVNAAGYCLGGTLLSIAAAAMAREGDERLGSITLLAAQVDFTEPGELSLFIDESEVSFLEATMWQQGYLDTSQMAGAFQLIRSNDLIWSRQLNHYLLNKPDQETALTSWNQDATRMPFRMHAEYLRRLFLNNDLAAGRYLVDARPVALSDIDVPVFAVGTVTDHVAPWRSVYKLTLLLDAELTFLLTSGGHNAGIISPPGKAGRSFQVATRAADAPFIDPGRWQEAMEHRPGSWWPEWEHWLARRAGPLVAPPAPEDDLEDAPGEYVRQP